MSNDVASLSSSLTNSIPRSVHQAALTNSQLKTSDGLYVTEFSASLHLRNISPYLLNDVVAEKTLGRFHPFYRPRRPLERVVV